MPAVPEPSASGSEKPAFTLAESESEPIVPETAELIQSDLLAQYGVTAIPLTSYEWGGYRYTNAHDAIAAAKRGASK